MTLGNDNGTDGQTTDRQTDRRTDGVRRIMRPPHREEGRIIRVPYLDTILTRLLYNAMTVSLDLSVKLRLIIMFVSLATYQVHTCFDTIHQCDG